MSSRILKFRPSDESILVERVLQSVHRSIDTKLPAADEAPAGYSRPVFSTEEATAFVKAADADDEEHATSNFDDIPTDPTQKADPSGEAVDRSRGRPKDPAHDEEEDPDSDPDTRLSSGFFELRPQGSGKARARIRFLLAIIIFSSGLVLAYWYLFGMKQIY